MHLIIKSKMFMLTLVKVILIFKLIASFVMCETEDSNRKQGEKWNPFYENIT